MKTISFLALWAFLASCTPRVFYLGDTYPTSQSTIEVFYDEGQIKRPYEIIGSLTSSDGSMWPSQSAQGHVQRAMIDQAKAIGADAVVFHDIEIDKTDDSRVVVLKAKAVRY